MTICVADYTSAKDRVGFTPPLLRRGVRFRNFVLAIPCFGSLTDLTTFSPFLASFQLSNGPRARDRDNRNASPHSAAIGADRGRDE